MGSNPTCSSTNLTMRTGEPCAMKVARTVRRGAIGYPSGPGCLPYTVGRESVPWVRIPPSPPLAQCKPENRSLAGPFSLCAKGVCRNHPPFGDWPPARDRSLNAHRLFPPAPRSGRDGFKIPICFSELTGSHCARVLLVPAYFDPDGDATRAAW